MALFAGGAPFHLDSDAHAVTFSNHPLELRRPWRAFWFRRKAIERRERAKARLDDWPIVQVRQDAHERTAPQDMGSWYCPSLPDQVVQVRQSLKKSDESVLYRRPRLNLAKGKKKKSASLTRVGLVDEALA